MDKILIVDDNEQNLYMLEIILKNSNFEVERAKNGKEALEKAKINPPKMIISDILMPTMDGFTLCRHLKQDDDLKNIPIIFYTATYTDPKDEEFSLNLGADRFLVKPVEPDIFIKIIKEVLEEHTKKQHLTSQQPLIEEKVYYKEYNEALVRKLEQKMLVLEKTNRELEILHKELKRKNNELEQIIYVASHDLRSPLVNIEGYSSELNSIIENILSELNSDKIPIDILNEVNSLKKDIYSYLSFIKSNVAKMDSLLAGLLRLSYSSKSILYVQRLDMNSLISNVIKMLDSKIKECEAKIEISDLPKCKGDEINVSQVFYNLIDNALKYSDPNRKCIIKISGIIDGEKAVYSVEDNGIGIAAEHKEKIFEIFYKLNPTKSKGEGLGLTIAQRILERLNGNIKVESKVGIGSKFFVSLPK